MICTPQQLISASNCIDCAMTQKQMWAALLKRVCDNPQSHDESAGQIVEYTGVNPTSDGVFPADKSKPAIAVQPGGTTYVWDVNNQVWDTGVLLNQLVAYWKFDTDAATGVLDSVGGNTLTKTGGSILAGGEINQYFSASGGNNMQLQSPGPDFQLGAGASFSISMWIKPNLGQSGAGYFAAHYSGVAATSSWLIAVNPKIQLSAYCLDGSTPNLVGPNQPSNAWHHVAFGYDSANKQLWLQLDAAARVTQATTADLRAATSNLWFANNISNTFFNGGIDETAFWKNRVLTTDEVTALYNGGAALPLSSYSTTL